MKQTDKRRLDARPWVIFFIVLVVAGVAVPYLFLTNIAKVYGAFLFWLVFSITAVAAVGKITAQWRD